MKKVFRNLLLMMMVLFPLNAFALSYSLERPMDGAEAGVVYINIVANDADGIIKQTSKLECATTNNDVKCEIEPFDGYEREGNIIISNQAFASGAKVGRMVLTNTKYVESITDVVFKVDGTTAQTLNNVKVGALKEPDSNDATIHKLSINIGEIDPEFKSDVDSYTIYGIKDTNRRIKFTYECDRCSIEFKGGASSNGSEVDLNIGENDVTATVTSQDRSATKTYNFKVIRGNSSYNSNKLKSISVGEYEISPKFDSNKFEYEVKVPRKVENIEKILEFSTEDSEAKTTVEGANKLDADENIVKITVTSRHGETQEYTLKVIKDDSNEIIEVIGYKDKKVSFMNVEGVREELSEDDFKTKYPNEWTKIENGTYKFDDNGNIVKESNTTDVDNKDEKKEEKKNSFPWLIVVLIILAIIIIAVAGFLIFREPNDDKKSKGKKDKKDEAEEPTKEEKEELEDIDSYNEEARLIADNNKKEEEAKAEEETQEVKVEDIKVEPIKPVVEENDVVIGETEDKTPTMDIDEALSDLMNTKEYNFKDEL